MAFFLVIPVYEVKSSKRAIMVRYRAKGKTELLIQFLLAAHATSSETFTYA
jgi:hypothetical protein